MKLDQVAPGVLRLVLWPRDGLNAYLLDDVLVDAGGKAAAPRLLRALSGHRVTGHAITHAHLDHQGASHLVCEALEIPLWCGAGDREAVETGDLTRISPDPDSRSSRFMQRFAGPAHPVARILTEGDEVGGFRVIPTPGHTPGHLAFWRESDRLLVLGDVLFHRNPMTLRKGLTEPFRFATHDAAQNRESARRLAALAPDVVCFGHGKPLRDTRAFAAYVSTLP